MLTRVPCSCRPSVSVCLFSVTNGSHEIVPEEVYREAEECAKAALADSDDDDDEDL